MVAEFSLGSMEMLSCPPWFHEETVERRGRGKRSRVRASEREKVSERSKVYQMERSKMDISIANKATEKP